MKNWSRFAGFNNEAILISALQRGDQLAVEYWFKHYYRDLKKIALAKLPSDQVAQEIVQDTFINCLQSLNLFRGQSALSTWMQSVLRHEIADYYRKRYAKKFIRTLPLSDLLLDKNYKNAESTAEQVRTVLKRMLQSNKELLMKKYVDKRSVKEIAFEMGKTVKAVESELFRARREFKEVWLELEANES